MSQFAVATQFAEALYHLQPSRIEPLPPLFDWRGMYRVHDARNRVWLLRLLRLPQAADALTQTAHLLQWLEQQHYPAPRLRLTRHHHRVGLLDGWASLLLSYIDGTVLDVHSTDFALLGHTLGQLHTLPLRNEPLLPRSRCDPAALLTHTARQLAQGKERVPSSVQPLVAALFESLARLAGHAHDLCVTHGDCWYKNAIKTADDRVVLIDWDCAGVGLPILDLGYLLLTTHYDLSQPFDVSADVNKIQAIVRGYQQVRLITRAERVLMESAVQFALAFHLGQYLEEHTYVTADDVVLRKMQARFAATTEIGQLAIHYVA